MAIGHVFQPFSLQPQETEMYFLCIKVTFLPSPMYLAAAALKGVSNTEHSVEN